MSERKVYHILTHEGGWQVRAEGAKRSSSVHQTKDEAVSRAKELARKHRLSQIKIHKQDGTLETEHTYGEDPRRFPG